MGTIIKSDSKEVIISNDRPFVIIGEKINPTGRKKLASALKDGDYEFVKQIALRRLQRVQISWM